MSMKLTPIAWLRIRTSLGPGAGVAISTSLSTSGPPVSLNWMARMIS